MSKSGNAISYYPEPDSKVYFSAATAFVRAIRVSPKLIRLTGGDRGQCAALESGYILIDQAHYAVKHRRDREERK